MNLLPIPLWLKISVLFISAFTPSLCFATKIERCSDRTPEASNEPTSYQILDPVSRRVWATRDWSPEAFDAFRFPLSQRLWRKSEPSILMADTSHLVKSPNCPFEGQYTYMKAFGREFVHLARIEDADQSHRKTHGFIISRLEKYHTVTYRGGRSISVLVDPDGRSYWAINRGLSADPLAAPDLPQGWSHSIDEVPGAYTSPAQGLVTVIRANNGINYQQAY